MTDDETSKKRNGYMIGRWAKKKDEEKGDEKRKRMGRVTGGGAPFATRGFAVTYPNWRRLARLGLHYAGPCHSPVLDAVTAWGSRTGSGKGEGQQGTVSGASRGEGSGVTTG